MFTLLLGGAPGAVFAGLAPQLPPPEVVLLQEVVDRSLAAHVRPHLEAAGYVLAVGSQQAREYFEVIAVRPPWRLLRSGVSPLDTSQGRELLWAEIEGDGHMWLVTTAHLESMPAGAALRMAQTAAVMERLRSWEGPALFGGDTNLRDAEAEQVGCLPDAWEACGEPATERWTRLRQTGARFPSRYDRVWGHRVIFSDFSCIGREPVTAGGATASDHLGVRVACRPA